MRPQLTFPFDLPRRPLDLASLCDDEERAVAGTLRWGRERARQIPEIAAEAGMGARRAQEVIQHLLFDHQWPIGTSMAEPYGNYLIDSTDELEGTVELLRTRGISNLARAAALKRMTLRQYLELVQGALELEEAS